MKGQRTGRIVVLIVEDNHDQREMYAMYLRHVGYVVEEAPDGAIGVSKAISRQPDIIVMDSNMPKMTGTDATRVLKSDPSTRHIPIITLSAYAMKAAEREALEAGADVYLPKPCLPVDLAAQITRQLHGGEQGASGGGMVISGGGPCAGLWLFDGERPWSYQARLLLTSADTRHWSAWVAHRTRGVRARSRDLRSAAVAVRRAA